MTSVQSVEFPGWGNSEFSISYSLVPRNVKLQGVHGAEVRSSQMASAPVQFCSLSTADPERKDSACWTLGGLLW